jgi:hypothetical protein
MPTYADMLHYLTRDVPSHIAHTKHERDGFKAGVYRMSGKGRLSIAHLLPDKGLLCICKDLRVSYYNQLCQASVHA